MFQCQGRGKDTWTGRVNPSAETLRLSYCNGQSTNGTKEILSPDFLVIKTKKFFSCNQNKGAWQLTLLLCSERMQKQVWTKKFLRHFQSEQPHGLTTQIRFKKLQAFCVLKAWRLVWSFDDPIWRADRSWWEAGQSTRPRCMGGSIQHILHAHPYHLLNHFFAATQILVGAINVNNIFVPTIYRCWSQR